MNIQIWIYPRIYNLQSFGISELIQKVMFLLVSQAIDLQNLAKFGHQEGHQFEYQRLGVWKSLKKSKKVGAHVSGAA
jgi:hypothetical protein